MPFTGPQRSEKQKNPSRDTVSATSVDVEETTIVDLCSLHSWQKNGILVSMKQHPRQTTKIETKVSRTKYFVLRRSICVGSVSISSTRDPNSRLSQEEVNSWALPGFHPDTLPRKRLSWAPEELKFNQLLTKSESCSGYILSIMTVAAFSNAGQQTIGVLLSIGEIMIFPSIAIVTIVDLSKHFVWVMWACGCACVGV